MRILYRCLHCQYNGWGKSEGKYDRQTIANRLFKPPNLSNFCTFNFCTTAGRFFVFFANLLSNYSVEER